MGGKGKKKKAAAATAASTNVLPANGDEQRVDTKAAANGDGIPVNISKSNRKKKAAAAAAAKDVPVNGDEPPVDYQAAANGDRIPPPMPTSVEPANGDGGAPPPPSLEAANGDVSQLDSSAAANEDGVFPPPPPLFPVEAPAPNNVKTPVDCAAEANGGVIPPVDSAAVANGDVAEPPPSAEVADNGGEPMKETGLYEEAPEGRRESSTEPEREVEKLKALNGMLVKEAVETRGQVAALSVLLDERFADADTLAGVERAVLQAGLIVPFAAAAEDCTALRGHLADVNDSLQAQKARAARQADARAEAEACLEAAEAENLGFVELLGGKDAEAASASASRNVAGMESIVSELAGNSTELCAEKGELEKQLGEMSASVRSVNAHKAEVEGSFRDYRRDTERYKQEMEDKLGEKSKQLEALRSSKEDMEVKFQSLQTELSAAVARNRELEFELETSKTELAAAKRKLEKLQYQVADVGKKYNTVVAEADYLQKETAKMMATKEAAVSALSAEKTKLQKEVDLLKRKVESIRANKDTVMASCREKDAEAAKLRAQLNGLSDSLAEQRVLCDDLRAKSSRLQDEVDTLKKALVEEKAAGDELRARLGELESYSDKKEREIVVLKTDVQNKRGQIYTLNGEIKKLQLAVAEGKSGKVWTWLCPTTTVIAAASFAYAARSR